jgi:hypothetical protein
MLKTPSAGWRRESQGRCRTWLSEALALAANVSKSMCTGQRKWLRKQTTSDSRRSLTCLNRLWWDSQVLLPPPRTAFQRVRRRGPARIPTLSLGTARVRTLHGRGFTAWTLDKSFLSFPPASVRERARSQFHNDSYAQPYIFLLHPEGLNIKSIGSGRHIRSRAICKRLRSQHDAMLQRNNSQIDFRSLSVPNLQPESCEHDATESDSFSRCGSTESVKEATDQEPYVPMNYICPEAYALLVAAEESAARSADALDAGCYDLDANDHCLTRNSLLVGMSDSSIVPLTPPKRFYRIFWQSVSLRLLYRWTRTA